MILAKENRLALPVEPSQNRPTQKPGSALAKAIPWLCILLTCCSTLQAAQPHVTLGIEAEDFQYQGGWLFLRDKPGFSDRGFLFASPSGASLPAATIVDLPRTGRYHLWVRALDFPTYRPGTRTLTVSVHGQKSTEIFGDSGQESWAWEPGGAFELSAGKTLLGIHDVSKSYGRVDAILLTTDEDLKPRGKLGTGTLRRIRPTEQQSSKDVDPLAPRPIQPTEQTPLATLENEFVRYTFLPATSEGHHAVVPRVELRQGNTWLPADVDPQAEIYSVVKTGQIEIRYSGTFPLWGRPDPEPVDLTVGDVTLTTSRTISPPEIWRAGKFHRFRPITAERTGDVVTINFEPSPLGQLVAQWRLTPGHRAANVKLSFTPTDDGNYSLGYHLFCRHALDEVEELQLPLAFQRKRFPEKAYMVLDPRAPTPFALAQTGAESQAVSYAVIGDPSEIPFAWPDRRKPNMGLTIRDEAGNVQPAIYGPIPGTDQAKAAAGNAITFRYNVLVQPGPWYAAYRTAADEVFRFHDYRRNGRTSLSDAVLNMIDLIKDDDFGGWWERAKGWYQIESRNTVTHSTPATMLSLYRLTGDQDLYRRRVLPTLQYVLSRDSVHFTPEPHDPGRYHTGPMGGPIRHFGSSTFSALSQLTGGYTPAFSQIALPPDKHVRPTVGYSHAQPFNEWAARYRVTGEPSDLEKAVELADQYLQKHVVTPPTRPVGYSPFWLISFVPDWEGLLMMYELTGQRRFLDGAVIGARQLMVGLWTHPLFPEGNTTIFPGGQYEGDPWNGHLLARGPDKSRLGFPLQEDSLTEHTAPAWSVSCVGLGFEQPSTLGAARNRLIYQAVWAPEFLRLARYTGDKAFETCARNATIGRWSNYPGYYVGGHIDLVDDPKYPFVGPDQSVIYYHHIVPHLSWTLDYLIADAELLSNGRIQFPSLRENGYAFFDGKVYGHAPGQIFDETDCWLWLKRGTITVDNPQINTLTAHNNKKFLAVLTNQDTHPQTATVSFSPEILGIDPTTLDSVTVRSTAEEHRVALKNGTATLAFQPRELLVVQVDDTKINVAPHCTLPEPQATHPTELEMPAGDVTVKAAAIAVSPGPWDAYIWCTAADGQARTVTFETRTDGQWQSHTDDDYPFEFNLPMSPDAKSLQFRVHWTDQNGQEFTTPEATLAPAHHSSHHAPP